MSPRGALASRARRCQRPLTLRPLRRRMRQRQWAGWQPNRRREDAPCSCSAPGPHSSGCSRPRGRTAIWTAVCDRDPGGARVRVRRPALHRLDRRRAGDRAARLGAAARRRDRAGHRPAGRGRRPDRREARPARTRSRRRPRSSRRTSSASARRSPRPACRSRAGRSSARTARSEIPPPVVVKAADRIEPRRALARPPTPRGSSARSTRPARSSRSGAVLVEEYVDGPGGDRHRLLGRRRASCRSPSPTGSPPRSRRSASRSRTSGPRVTRRRPSR